MGQMMHTKLILRVFFLLFYGLSLSVSAAPDVKVQVYTKYERMPNGNTFTFETVKITARDKVSIKNIEFNRGGCNFIRDVSFPIDLNFGGVFDDYGTNCDAILEIAIDFGDQKKVYQFE